ncbi:glycosyltransferase [Mucilaginibacter sp. CAU 1740]|uniref:glycosyltransferase n=1 Tax=Mucilaginibacter sp. CAU 1740 TaxID=3140365 RepID=UPI00325C0B13
MKVLHVISSMDPKMGGVCEAVRITAVGLQTLGIHNEVVCVDEETYHQDTTYTQHNLGPSKNPWYYSNRLLPWLNENIGRFDAVIVHGLWLYHGYAANKAFQNLKKKGGSSLKTKLFVMPHGMLDPYFQRAKTRRLKALRNVIYWGLIEKHIINNADELLFTCQTELQLAREPFWPYKPKRETVVGLGVEAPPAYNASMLSVFEEKIPAVKGSPYLLFLSRIHEKKGVDMLLHSYTKIIEQQTSDAGQQDLTNVPKLVIAGPGLESDYGLQLKETVDNSELLSKLVHFPGMLTGEAKWGAFYGCEAFVLPSHQENFGIAVVEALTCNKPVLISNQVNIWPEIEQAGGAIVADDTLIGTFEMLDKWSGLASTDKDKMAAGARHCYEKHFAIDAVINNFYQILKN